MATEEDQRGDEIAKIKAMLGSEFPGWRFLLTDRGRWWAMRGPLPEEGMTEIDCLEADTPEELRSLMLQAEV